jgi:hypothetical protein
MIAYDDWLEYGITWGPNVDREDTQTEQLMQELETMEKHLLYPAFKLHNATQGRIAATGIDTRSNNCLDLLLWSYFLAGARAESDAHNLL